MPQSRFSCLLSASLFSPAKLYDSVLIISISYDNNVLYWFKTLLLRLNYNCFVFASISTNSTAHCNLAFPLLLCFSPAQLYDSAPIASIPYDFDVLYWFQTIFLRLDYANSTDCALATTLPVDFSDPPLFMKLDALQVSRSYFQYIDKLVRYGDPSDSDIQSLLSYYKELLRQELNYICLGIVSFTILSPPSHLSPDWPHNIKTPSPSPLASPATQLQEYKSPFYGNNDKDDTPVWVSQVVAYIVRKAGAIWWA